MGSQCADAGDGSQIDAKDPIEFRAHFEGELVFAALMHSGVRRRGKSFSREMDLAS